MALLNRVIYIVEVILLEENSILANQLKASILISVFIPICEPCYNPGLYLLLIISITTFFTR